MAGGYKFVPQGIAAIAERIRGLERRLAKLEAGAISTVGNDALVSPVTFGVFNGDGTGTLLVSLSLLGELFAGTIAVPAGYSQALVLCTAIVGGTNGNAAANGIYCSAAVNGLGPNPIAMVLGNGIGGSVPSTYATRLTGLSGGTIRVSAYAAVDLTGWTGGNGHVSAVAIFTR